MKKHIEAHSSNKKFTQGDSYGNAIRNKVGRVRDSYMNGVKPNSKNSLKKPPKSLA